MQTLHVELVRVDPGEVELVFPYDPMLTQQHGFIHGGILSTALDSASGYAAFSLMPADAAVLTIEFKVNLLSPARGDRFQVIGRVVKPGRTIIVCQGEACAHVDAQPKLVETMTATLMAVFDRQDVQE